jgi:hypothetical protein
MLNIDQLRNLIVQPTLKDLNLYSTNMESLLLFTCAVESQGGTYLHQIEGPAIGIYQIEPETYNDIWTNYITTHQGFKLILLHLFNAPIMQDEYRLIYDLRYATAMCAIFYERLNYTLPSSTFPSMWEFYKSYYNTSKGKAQEDMALKDWVAFNL